MTDELKLTDLIRVWKRNDTNATWEALAEALRICHGTVTADKLREAVTGIEWHAYRYHTDLHDEVKS